MSQVVEVPATLDEAAFETLIRRVRGADDDKARLLLDRPRPVPAQDFRTGFFLADSAYRDFAPLPRPEWCSRSKSGLKLFGTEYRAGSE